MSKIIFKPYIGKNYISGGIFAKKILVLGESHYCSEEEVYDSLTSDVLEKYLKHESSEGWMNTFKKFERSLVGKITDENLSKKIWDSIAFYNYLQVAIGDSRLAGTDADYKNAAEPFFEVLNQLRPDVLIIWGKRLWNKTPGAEKWISGKSVVVDGYENPTGKYILENGKEVFTTPVYHHPSAGFSWEYCYRVFKEMKIV